MRIARGARGSGIRSFGEDPESEIRLRGDIDFGQELPHLLEGTPVDVLHQEVGKLAVPSDAEQALDAGSLFQPQSLLFGALEKYRVGDRGPKGPAAQVSSANVRDDGLEMLDA